MTGAALRWACALVSCAGLAWGALVDARCRRIPNAACALVAGGALAQMALAALLEGALSGAALGVGADVGSGAGLLGTPGVQGALPLWGSRLGAAVLTLVVLGGFEALWRHLKGTHGLGAGDIKLLAAQALWLGPHVVVVLALACVLAALVALARHQQSFAFGPYLAGFGGVALVLLCAA